MTSIKIRSEQQNSSDGIRVLNLAQDKSGGKFLAGVAIDDTFNITQYNFRLAALMVADKKDRGLPADELFTIKKIFPEFKPKEFLSDEALSFYNDYKVAFPENNALLLFCRFHILQTWLRKAKE
ncbi:unnamed protein product, partial [Strongylus vulgaris]